MRLLPPQPFRSFKPMTTVLIVEDDEDLRRIMRWGLEAEGFEVACAADGQQALEAVSRLRPDLVVLDWELPILNGIEVCTLIRNAEHSVGIPVIMVTGHYEADDIRCGIEAGADAYVTKPFAVETLAEKIRCVLEQTAARMALTQPHSTATDGPSCAASEVEARTPVPVTGSRSDSGPKTVPGETCTNRGRRRSPCRGRTDR